MAELIAIGDSITEGFTNGGFAFYPFTKKLELLLNNVTHFNILNDVRQERLQETGLSQPLDVDLAGTTKTAWSQNCDIRIRNFGRSGEKTREIHDRLNAIILSLKNKKHPCKFATLLAGLNDLDDIHHLPELGQLMIDDIKSMCSKLWKHDCRFIFLMTLPVCFLDSKLPWYREVKKRINKQIRRQCAQLPGVTIVDIANEISFLKMSDQDQRRYFSDELHFSPEGYDMLAAIIFKSFCSTMQKLHISSA